MLETVRGSLKTCAPIVTTARKSGGCADAKSSAMVPPSLCPMRRQAWIPAASRTCGSTTSPSTSM